FKGVVRGHAVGQFQEPFEPRQAFLGKEHDLMPVITVSDDTTDSQHHDVQQQMSRAANNTWIFEPAKVLLHWAKGSKSRHAFLRVRGERRAKLRRIVGSVHWTKSRGPR